MPTLHVLLSNPDAEVRTEADRVLIRALPTAAGRAREPDPQADGTAVEITLAQGRVQHVRATRGITTSYELYYRRADDGGLTLSDSFAALLASTPRAARRVEPAALADHLLFRTTPGEATYAAGLQRLGQGNLLSWDARSGACGQQRALRLQADGALSRAAAVDAVERALAEAMSEVPEGGRLANLLSGGIDSTLLHTYCAPQTPSTSVAIDSPEFAFEAGYAQSASRLLGSRHHLLPAREAEYLERLEACIDALGMPPHHLQTVLLDIAFQGPFARFLTGQLADALFGLETAIAASRAWHLRFGLRAAGGGLGPRLGGGVRARVERLGQLARQLARAPDDPAGYAMQFAVYSDLRLAAELLGPELVQQRLRARAEYVLARVPAPAGAERALARHLHLGHWIDFYCDDTVSLWRQLAQSRGKALHAPFTHPAVARVALAVPPGERYLHRQHAKPIPKALLRRRLPAYPVHQSKGGSGLPLTRYLRSGPLTAAFERYALPDWLPLTREQLAQAPAWIVWNALTFSIWQTRVLQRDDLAPPPATRRLQWPAGPAA